jgi:hypothetical protein
MRDQKIKRDELKILGVGDGGRNPSQDHGRHGESWPAKELNGEVRQSHCLFKCVRLIDNVFNFFCMGGK